MSKIKDLVTVTVDTAYRAFPLDKERYELLDVLRVNALAITKYDERCFPSDCDERVKVFLNGVHENFERGANAFARVAFAGFPRALPNVVEDRAERVRASLIAVPDQHWLRAPDSCEMANLVEDALWLEFFVKFSVTESLLNGYRSPLGHGGST